MKTERIVLFIVITFIVSLSILIRLIVSMWHRICEFNILKFDILDMNIELII